MNKIRIIGGGLAGCEACYQLLKRGYEVELYEMRGEVSTPAHETDNLAELVCSNSLKSMVESTASGTLKEELKQLDSLLIDCAYKTSVPAGGALAVDRALFSQEVEHRLSQFDNLQIIRQEVDSIDYDIPTIIATGPLTSNKLLNSIKDITGDKNLHFYDAVAPIINADSIDYDNAFFGARYNKGGADYLNLPMRKEEYLAFYHELVNAKRVELHNFEKREIFESCMPIEIMASRGEDSIRFGPLKPVGLYHPITNEKYYAVVQLRLENSSSTMYNMVGFQTNLTWGEQKRVFGMIPALSNAEYYRYGVMHKNTFINAPKILNPTFSVQNIPKIYFAGQITGVEGYVESIMSGLIAGINLARELEGKTEIIPPTTTITGALMRHIAIDVVNYQPMNANFGILDELESKIRDKKLKKQMYFDRAKADMEVFVSSL